MLHVTKVTQKQQVLAEPIDHQLPIVMHCIVLYIVLYIVVLYCIALYGGRTGFVVGEVGEGATAAPLAR